MVFVLSGAIKSSKDVSTLVADVLKLEASGLRMKDAVAEIAELNGVSKSVLYQLSLDAKK
jgi:16S rRNA (cytidine1402-2'-O)-methyltransferase